MGMTTTIDGSNSVTINSGAILGITSGTVQASTSGTSIDFTSIPSWVKRITVMFAGVTTNGTSAYLLQIGAGSVANTGYVAFGSYNGGSNAGQSSTAGFPIYSDTASQTVQGNIMLCLLNSSNGTWSVSGTLGSSNSFTRMTAGYKTLSGTLDRVRLTTAGGTDTFSAGSINILYE
jgi:hypothetical protein